MKLLHRLNPFRGKALAVNNDDNEDTGDDYDEFPLNPPPRITSSPESMKTVRATFLDDMFLDKPASAYHVPTKPRDRRPLRSCPGDIEDPSDSSEFDKIEAFRRQNQRKKLTSVPLDPPPPAKRIPGRASKKTVCFADEKPNVKSDALSPVSAVLRKYRIPTHHPDTPITNTVHYSKYKDCKRRCYDAEVMRNYSEGMLKRAYTENNRLIDEISKLKCKNDLLKSRLAQLEAQSKYNCKY
uniref:BZIP domain-containing protein n=1 Tax=Panagrellus redivivus TaxID=6233 RepID=A0A7E4VLI1_PANRE